MHPDLGRYLRLAATSHAISVLDDANNVAARRRRFLDILRREHGDFDVTDHGDTSLTI